MISRTRKVRDDGTIEEEMKSIPSLYSAQTLQKFYGNVTLPGDIDSDYTPSRKRKKRKVKKPEPVILGTAKPRRRIVLD